MTHDPGRPRLRPLAEDRAANPARDLARYNEAGASRRALVRCIASDPDLIEWLRAHVAKRLNETAATVEQQHGPKAAATVRIAASAYRRGELPLW